MVSIGAGCLALNNIISTGFTDMLYECLLIKGSTIAEIYHFLHLILKLHGYKLRVKYSLNFKGCQAGIGAGPVRRAVFKAGAYRLDPLGQGRRHPALYPGRGRAGLCAVQGAGGDPGF